MTGRFLFQATIQSPSTDSLMTHPQWPQQRPFCTTMSWDCLGELVFCDAPPSTKRAPERYMEVYCYSFDSVSSVFLKAAVVWNTPWTAGKALYLANRLLMNTFAIYLSCLCASFRLINVAKIVITPHLTATFKIHSGSKVRRN